MSNLSFLDAVEGVREACVVAKARIQHEIDYTKNQLHDKYGVLMETEAKMATGQLHFKGILNYCRFGYCSK